MGLFPAILIAAGQVLIVHHYWKRGLAEDWLKGGERSRFWRWVVMGLGVPILFWTASNLGLVGQPVWPAISPVTEGFGAWWKSFLGPWAAGIFHVGTYWAGVSLLWLVGLGSERTPSPAGYWRAVIVWAFLLSPVLLAVLLIRPWGGLGVALMLHGLGLLEMTFRLKPEVSPPPSYNVAMARFNFGRYEEAEQEIIRELEQHEDDFDGWMLLAELYAEKFGDLAGAAQIVRDVCAHPETTPPQMAMACHRLADWQLKLAQDPVAAREVLEQLCQRLPGSHLERMARQRLSSLPNSAEELRRRQNPGPIRIHVMPDAVTPVAPNHLSRELAAELANQAVALLEKNPDDVAARERFARLLAENLGRVGQGAEQIEMLLAMPGIDPGRRADWLLMLAGWHAQLLEDAEQARLVLERVVRDFPQSRQAFAAQCRLRLLEMRTRYRSRLPQVGG